MTHITIVGSGAYGTKIAEKYKRFNDVKIRAVISRSKPRSDVFFDIPFMISAIEWKSNFGAPSKNDVFDICVHQNILIGVLSSLIHIGARNFILPKPIALNKEELDHIQKLTLQYKLKVLIASQWHYSDLVKKIAEFLENNRHKTSQIEIVFSRLFDSNRKSLYSAQTAFLPHIIQILHDLKLIKNNSYPTIECVSNEKIKIRYTGNKLIRAESNIAGDRSASLKIFLNKKVEPILVADFSGVFGPNGFIMFPKVTIKGKNIEIKKDVLEAMIKKNISFFEGGSKSAVLTLDKYLPVARQIIRIADASKQVVGIIGGGLFGIMAALEMSKRGFSVIIFEKEKEIMTGASLVNHTRIHMGYHYPRDKKTVIQSLRSKDPFEKFFDGSVVRKIRNYYMVAKEGSMTSHNKFLSFCKKMKLPYKVSWPSGLKILKERIAISTRVPETIFDANNARSFLLKKISQENITLLTNSQVVDLDKKNGRFIVNYSSEEKKETAECAALVNATYGAINNINDMLKLPLQTFQYELCELPIVRVPWRGLGWMIMDGPFFSAMPFGYSRNHLFYDVELSVLERTVGKFPSFKFGVDHYNTQKGRVERFNKYKEKWRPWVQGSNNWQYISSMYVTRVVLPNTEKTDTRPTIIKELIPGFWQVFSGKIATSVPVAEEISNKIDKFLRRKG
ncbi:MAG: hypothetical protein COV30_01100 [Candidatus Yanofskybacteria bacterium CG10_big_fil_rev_8_21_14_0_10_37_15]|uniref:FAD dependent oxidoreductase domain-containing protein n=1 Tax=Candidatus Yanofskybacteria bacterium CG10_big_fil_rev_8_21_14_0_10_37_15 TaxID=1975097 RepID=A0A2H0R5Z2_9BACT|nr:MAG: hypothetical protein COV30_01100 [Candidatus Yanofskybacteria bacterium CG10_big_fil_rev_8_21_14_0_10_37_15]